jgi:hypothetical protein
MERFSPAWVSHRPTDFTVVRDTRLPIVMRNQPDGELPSNEKIEFGIAKPSTLIRRQEAAP